jgi:hypothetical protein
MQKRIVTVTCDSTMSSPGNPHNPTPRGIDAVAEEYISAIDAGASICHLHGPYSVDAEIQAGGTKLSGLDGCDMIANDNVRGRSALRGVAARLLRDPLRRRRGGSADVSRRSIPTKLSQTSTDQHNSTAAKQA